MVPKMLSMPATMKRHYNWKDKVFSVEGAFIALALAAVLCWSIALIWPEKGWFLFMLSRPLPGHLGDAGLFWPIHVWAAYEVMKYRKSYLMLNNPWLCTIDGHYSIDVNHGSHKIGPHTLIGLGALTTTKPGRTYAEEGWAAMMTHYLKPRDRDTHADVRLVPVKMTQMPLGVFRQLHNKGISPDSFFYFGFPEEYFRPNAEGIARFSEILAANEAINSSIKHAERSLEAAGDHIDAISTMAKQTLTTARGGRILPDTPEFAQLGERNGPIVLDPYRRS